MKPASLFRYDMPEYADLPSANQWYRWVSDVQTFIAEQYGIGGIVTDGGDRSVSVFIYPDEWSEQECSIVRAAHTVWYRSSRLEAEGWGDTPQGYQWMQWASDALTAAIEGREHERKDYRAEWVAAHPEYQAEEERRELERARSAGRLF